MSPVKQAIRGQLNRDTVVDKALAVAAEEGLAAVTIRRLANEFDVTPMALYWHFKTKDDLLAALAVHILDGVKLDCAPDAPWSQRVRAALNALLEALRARPQVAPLVPTQILLCESGLGLTEYVLRALADAGFSTAHAAQIASQAMLTAITMVNSESVYASVPPGPERDQELRLKRAHLAALAPERYPHLLAAADDLIQCDDEDTFFAFGVDLFIAGIEGLAPGTPR